MSTRVSNKGGLWALVAPSESISISFQKGAIDFVYFIHTRKQGERGKRVGYKISQEKGM
jgi:hypothetical protein